MASTFTIRLPESRQVGLSERVRELIDHPDFQRLRSVRQLGPTHLVYPGAVHTRFEHSLGVYDLAGKYLDSLLRDPNVAASLSEADLQACLLAALLHDVGHYPFAHSLEAVHLPGQDTPRHEDLGGRIIRGEFCAEGQASLGQLIERNFDLDAEEVISLITSKPQAQATQARRLVATIISSGIDADKADYLERDSLHMGVTYGRNYDRPRFLESLCVHPDGDKIAVSEKGKVSAEIFVFSRYLMFSEAYWHHTVRSASAMIEHALADFRSREQMEGTELERLLLSRSDDALLDNIRSRSPEGSPARSLLEAMGTGNRHLHKRVLTLNRVSSDLRYPAAYDLVYNLDADRLAKLQAALLEHLERAVGRRLPVEALIIDTPPRDKDRTESTDVIEYRDGVPSATHLEDLSKVVKGIADDFIKVVKKIRVFVRADVRDELSNSGQLSKTRRELLGAILNFEVR